MPADLIAEQIRASVHDLHAGSEPGVAEIVALAMVRGAAQAFCELAPAKTREVHSRLLAALDLPPEAVLSALST